MPSFDTHPSKMLLRSQDTIVSPQGQSAFMFLPSCQQICSRYSVLLIGWELGKEQKNGLSGDPCGLSWETLPWNLDLGKQCYSACS